VSNLFEIEVTTLAGERTSMATFKGQVLLIVNVASACGFTPQYEGLEQVYRTYAPRGFSVLGFPCNQFGGQEPGAEEEIRAFCKTRYDVTFPMFAKVSVNGPEAHPLFVHLKKAAPGLLGTEGIKWNFTKFLLDRSGEVRHRYAPNTTPASLARDIERYL
jgi:glutathione peroxidase